MSDTPRIRPERYLWTVDIENDQPDSGQTDDGLLPRLRVIEDQPLQERAASYAALHDRLSAALEGGDGLRA